MKKVRWIASIVAVTLLGMGVMPPMGGAPQQGTTEAPETRWVEGKVKDAEGAPCRRCCTIRVETNLGLSGPTCSDDEATYFIEVAADVVTSVYFRGDRVWSGRRGTLGGAKIDISAG